MKIAVLVARRGCYAAAELSQVRREPRLWAASATAVGPASR